MVNYEGQTQQSYGQYNQAYGQYGQSYGNHGQYNQNHGQVDQNYNQYNQSYGQPHQNYGQYAQDYGQSSQNYGQYQQGGHSGYPKDQSSTNLQFGNKDAKYDEDSKDFYGGMNSLSADLDRSIRHAFVRKVFTILSICLLISFGFAACVNLVQSLQDFVFENYLVILIVSVVLYIVPSLMLVCSDNMAQKVPLNYILLSLMVIGVSGLLGTVGAITSPFIFFLAVGITFAVSLALILFAIQVKYDFTGWGPYICTFSLIFLILIIVGIFVRQPIFHLIISGIGTVFISFLIIFDTQMIVGGKHRKYQLSIDEYMTAVVILYIDIVALFMYLVQIITALTDS